MSHFDVTCVHGCAVPACGGQRTNGEVSSLLPLRESQGSNTGLRAWWRALLPAESCPWPLQGTPLTICIYTRECVYGHFHIDRQGNKYRTTGLTNKRHQQIHFPLTQCQGLLSVKNPGILQSHSYGIPCPGSYS